MEEFGSFGWAAGLMAAEYNEKALEECNQVIKMRTCPHCGSSDVDWQVSSGMGDKEPGMASYHCKNCGKGAKSLTFEKKK